MAKYIPKDALVAKIEKKIEEIRPYCGACSSIVAAEANNKIAVFEYMKDFLNTLEVKEIDLKEEVERFAKECGYKSAATIDFQFAKHFFELGIFSQPTWQDIRFISELGEDFMNSEESDNLSEEEYYTAILNKLKKKGRDYETNGQRIRNLTQKGE